MIEFNLEVYCESMPEEPQNRAPAEFEVCEAAIDGHEISDSDLEKLLSITLKNGQKLVDYFEEQYRGAA